MNCTTHHICDCKNAEIERLKADVQHYKMLTNAFQQKHLKAIREKHDFRTLLAEARDTLAYSIGPNRDQKHWKVQPVIDRIKEALAEPSSTHPPADPS